MQKYETEHLNLVLDTAAECTLFLKKNGEFPLKTPGKLDAFGAGVRYTVKGGTGSGEVNSRFTRTIEEGLENQGFEITSKDWLNAYDEVRFNAQREFLKNLKKEARAKKESPIFYSMGKIMKEPNHKLSIQKNSDTAIYVLSRVSGEGTDREVVEGDVKLAQSEIRDILALNQMYEKFMLVLNVGGVVDLSPVMDVSNILLLSQLGVDCGKILADILTGKQNPSGKLTTTWSAWEDYCDLGTFGDPDETRYKEGIYVGYRYFDKAGQKALFPFGYGLSYTEFEISTEEVFSSGDIITLGVKIKNKGTYPGKEVVQVYVSMPEDKLEKPYQDLVAFKKTSLILPKEEETLEISFRLSDFASYDEGVASYVLERGDYIIRIGNSLVSTKVVAVVNLDETLVTFKAKNCLGKPDFTDESIPANPDSYVNISDIVKRIEIKKEDIVSLEASYDFEYEIDPLVEGLSDEELAYMNIGGFDPSAGSLSIIGNAGRKVAGTAGETTSQLIHKGVEPLVMADGPAGIRVAKHYFEEKGRAYDASGGGMLPESIIESMNPLLRFVVRLLTGGRKVPKDAKIKEHMATMIPIGTALAQSFNLDLVEKYGDIVGSEMELFGIDLWLAPALNIHRSILCGRNFEYYSEDPFVSGMTAAAITKGVQNHKGCGVTIKHYAANNCETNRYCNNSQVSERAMREIYLRGFEICVKQSNPRAVMTSYNLLNGTHTSEHRGLIEDILRREYGFHGIVMTDWVIALMTGKGAKYRNALSDQVSLAGGDLFMPGGKGDYERLLKSIKENPEARKQAKINATRVSRLSQWGRF